MSKNISEEMIRAGIIGKSMGGAHFKAFISVVEGCFFTGYEVQKEMRGFKSGEVLKPGDFLEVEEKPTFREAMRDVMPFFPIDI
jgi:hypothetical protein